MTRREKEAKKPVQVVVVRKRFLYLIVITLITSMISPFAGIVYVNWVDRKNRSEWCELIVTFDDAYQESPPSSQTASKVAELMHRRRESLGCT